MKPTFEVVFNKANKLISKKKEALLIGHINSALNVIHETEYYKILDFLRDKGVNLSCITDIPENNDNDKIKVYYIKKGIVVGDHSHEFVESYICLFGKIKISSKENTHIVNSFETFKIDKYDVHSCEFLEDTFLVVFAQ